MWMVGGLLVLSGLCGAVVGCLMLLWRGTRARGRTVAFYGTAAFLFGIVPLSILEPPAIAVPVAETTTEPQAISAAAPRAQLRLRSWRCYEEYGFQHIEGRVTNQTDRAFNNDLVVASFETSAGRLVKNETALVQFQPLMPGQTSPFTLVAIGNPQIDRCEIGFQIMSGPALSFDR